MRCVCGYKMCYLCRADVTKDGYAHFCGHFRLIPGMPCTSCQLCSLYENEVEDHVIGEAEKRAECEWEEEGSKGNLGSLMEGKRGRCEQLGPKYSFVVAQACPAAVFKDGNPCYSRSGAISLVMGRNSYRTWIKRQTNRTDAILSCTHWREDLESRDVAILMVAVMNTKETRRKGARRSAE